MPWREDDAAGYLRCRPVMMDRCAVTVVLACTVYIRIDVRDRCRSIVQARVTELLSTDT